MSFLPVTPQECRARGWETPDFVYVTGDAYVDHPSFGLAIISRVLEKAGYRVAMLPQPDWHSCEDFQRFGRPRLGFLVTAGVIDSMVNHYTVAKKPRDRDVYSPGGRAGMRPDRATIVYANRIRQAYGNVPILLGGASPTTTTGTTACAIPASWTRARTCCCSAWAKGPSSAPPNGWRRAVPSRICAFPAPA